MGFLLSNPIFLTALAALGVPVLIHLLLKRKNQRLRFSTLRFFKQHEEQANQKRKLRNLLLLALRMLILALLVLAFARPFLPLSGAAAKARNRQQAVLVLDRSLSMSAGAGAAARWNAARRAARDYLASLSGDDRVALVLCGDRPTVAAGFSAPTVVSAMVADLLPGTSPADLSEGLREAARVIELCESGLETSIAVVSDLQRAGAANLAQALLPPKVAVKLLPVGDLLTPNLAVTELDLGGAEARTPHATVVSFSDEDVPAIDAELSVDGKVAWTRLLSLPAGSSTNLELNVPRLAPGWHDIALALKPKTPDAQPLDDVRHQAVLVPQPVRVWIVEGRGGRRSFEEETFFVATALDPFAGATNAAAAPSPFRVEKLNPAQLPARLRAAVAAGAPRLSADVVVLPAPRQEVTGLVPALTDFVNAGGGLLLFPADGVAPLRFNNTFGPLLPANLKTLEAARGEAVWHLGELDSKAPYFSLFAKNGSGDPALAEFTRRFTLDVLPELGSITARFDDDVPAVVGRTLGRGQVLLVNSTADTAWNDWPKHKSYVPWLHRVVQHLAGRSGEEALRTGAEVVAGTHVDLMSGRTNAVAGPLRIVQPDGPPVALAAAKDGRWPEFEAVRPGVYRVTDAGGAELRRFAANVAPSEADLAALRPQEFKDRIARSQAGDEPTLAGSLLGNDRNQREFWRVLLLGALVLLVVETLWSNRTYA